MKYSAVALGLTFCLLSVAYAEDKLPSALTGIAMGNGGNGSQQTVAPMSIMIESQAATGEISGKLSWSSQGGCDVSNRPISGTYRDGVLDLSAPAIQNCEAITLKLKQVSASESAFNGTAALANALSASVTLRPR